MCHGFRGIPSAVSIRAQFNFATDGFAHGIESRHVIRRADFHFDLTHSQARHTSGESGGVFRLMASLLYGAGLRRLECCQLRVHDLDLGRQQILVRHGKGGKDRIVMLPRLPRGKTPMSWPTFQSCPRDSR